MKQRTFSQIENCVFNCFAVVCNDVYSVYIFESFEHGRNMDMDETWTKHLWNVF